MLITDIELLLGRVALGCDTKYSTVEGEADGSCVVGIQVGTVVGMTDGIPVGTIVGIQVTENGALEGDTVGISVGLSVGERLRVGVIEGAGEMVGKGCVGDKVGEVG